MKRPFLVIIVVGIILAGVIFFLKAGPFQGEGGPLGHKDVACTDEAKICPDRTVVGRTGPHCDFRACPETLPGTVTPPETEGIPTDAWKSFTDEQQSITYRYPDPFPATYISAQDWPPRVTLGSGPLSCPGNSSDRTPGTADSQRTIGGDTYCVTTESEGAAGSTYTTYAYAVKKDVGLVSFHFTLRFVQCMNYDDPEQSACTSERNSTDIDALVQGMVDTLTLTPGVSAARTSGISGSVRIVSDCTNQTTMAGQATGDATTDGSCASQPVQERFVVSTPDGRISGRFSSDENGIFAVTLPPGQYLIQEGIRRPGDTAPFASLPVCRTSDPVTVSAETFSQTSILCVPAS